MRISLLGAGTQHTYTAAGLLWVRFFTESRRETWRSSIKALLN
ncbi:hypothetical protein [Pusillimonas sp. ANT_WB101]|nr:hypothetical protein [Pusillimonas sp. ANT_WB101]